MINYFKTKHSTDFDKNFFITANVIPFHTNSTYPVDDITLRALEVLKNSDIILCEDTRRSIKLLSHYKIKKKLISYHKFNEKKQLTKIIEYFNEGKILSLISDAGTPLLSDPGRLLVNHCLENGIQITPIPGVSSITSALSISGFKDQFLFYGFLPKTQNELDKVLAIDPPINPSPIIIIFIKALLKRLEILSFQLLCQL